MIVFLMSVLTFFAYNKTWSSIPLRVVTKREEQAMLMSKFHESPWSGHGECGPHWKN